MTSDSLIHSKENQFSALPALKLSVPLEQSIFFTQQLDTQLNYVEAKPDMEPKVIVDVKVKPEPNPDVMVEVAEETEAELEKDRQLVKSNDTKPESDAQFYGLNPQNSQTSKYTTTSIHNVDEESNQGETIEAAAYDPNKLDVPGKHQQQPSSLKQPGIILMHSSEISQASLYKVQLLNSIDSSTQVKPFGAIDRKESMQSSAQSMSMYQPSAQDVDSDNDSSGLLEVAEKTSPLEVVRETVADNVEDDEEENHE